MEAKKLDATVLDSPQTVQARRLGFRVLADGVELGIPFLQGGLVTRRAYIKSNEDTVRHVVRVMLLTAKRLSLSVCLPLREGHGR